MSEANKSPRRPLPQTSHWSLSMLMQPHFADVVALSSWCLFMTYSFYGNFWARVLPRIAVDVLRCFPANCLYGGRIRKTFQLGPKSRILKLAGVYAPIC